MSRNFGKVWNCVSTVLVALVVLLAALLAGARLFGLQVFTILSGSMEPKYPVGSLIYVKSVDPSQVKEGDVITFLLSDTVTATHRVVEIVDQGDGALRFRTKGDANDSEDGGLVHSNNLLGTPVFTIPYLGYVANYIQHPPGMYVAIAGAAVLLILVFLPDVFAKDGEGKKKSGKAGKDSDGSAPQADGSAPDVPDEAAHK